MVGISVLSWVIPRETTRRKVLKEDGRLEVPSVSYGCQVPAFISVILV